MTLSIEVDGTEYTGFIDAEVNIRLDALTNTFRFSASSNNQKPMPFSVGQSCTIRSGTELLLTGSIELINVDGDSESHTIDIAGRDKTGDLLDSTIGSLSDIRAPISLKAIIEKVIAHIGTNITVVDLANPEIFTKAQDVTAPEPGQMAWDYIERYARKRQVLLTSNALGQVVITQSSGVEVNAVIKHKLGSNDNTVLRYAVSYDNTGRFNKYVALGQNNPLALIFAGETSNSAIVSQKSEVFDDLIREGRQLALVAETSSASADLKKRVQWDANIRKARGKVYSATVRGHINQTNNLWDINELVKVEDDRAGINSRMLVNSIKFKSDKENADTSLISFVEKNAYTLSLEEPTTDKTGEGGLVLPTVRATDPGGFVLPPER